MEILAQFIDFFLHLDKHLAEVIQQYGSWTYGILFLIVFCETGLVVTPFLPGDSLLFAAGAFAGRGALDVWTLVGLLLVAAIAGDAVNYQAGKIFGTRVFSENARFLKKSYLRRTEEFYDRYGGKTIIIARFVPIVRTFAPFLAGVGTMSYFRFALYNVTGAILWVVSLSFGGFFFSELPVVKNNFGFVIVAIIVLSVMPAIMEVVKSYRVRKAS